jgi:hypothetical protein
MMPTDLKTEQQRAIVQRMQMLARGDRELVRMVDEYLLVNGLERDCLGCVFELKLCGPVNDAEFLRALRVKPEGVSGDLRPWATVNWWAVLYAGVLYGAFFGLFWLLRWLE